MDAESVAKIRAYLSNDPFAQASRGAGDGAELGEIADASERLKDSFIAGLEAILRAHGDDSTDWDEARYARELTARGFGGIMQLGNRQQTLRDSYFWRPDGLLVVMRADLLANRLLEVDLLFNWAPNDAMRDAWTSACIVERSGLASGKAAWGDEVLRARFRTMLDIRLMSEGRWCHRGDDLIFAGCIPARCAFDYHLSRVLLNSEGALRCPWVAFPKDEYLGAMLPGMCTGFLEAHPWMSRLVTETQRHHQLLTPPADV